MNRQALLATALLAIAGCAPQELVLRPSVVSWGRMGVTRVSVVAVAPGTFVAAKPASGSARPLRIQLVSSAGLSADASPSLDASPSANASPSLDADATVLAHESAEAAQLLSFALAQSAFDLAPAGPRAASLELAVTSLTFARDDGQSDDASAPADASDSQGASGPVGGGLFAQPDLKVTAVLEARLLLPGQSRPIWKRRAVGVVPFQASQALFSDSDQLDPATIALLRGIAVRRALRHLARELLPRYQYQELP